MKEYYIPRWGGSFTVYTKFRRVGLSALFCQHICHYSSFFRTDCSWYYGATTHHRIWTQFVVDYFTIWPEAFSLSNQEAATVAEVLVKEYVCRYGVPLSLHSDQGRNFECHLIQEMCPLLGIKKTRTTPWHLQSDGLAESINRTLESQLSKFISQNQWDRDHFLSFMMMALQSATQESTESTPAMLQTVRELRLPVDLLVGCLEEHLPVHSYNEKLQKTLETIHEYARENMQLSSELMQTYYDQRSDYTTFHQRYIVWLYNTRRVLGISPKYMLPWEGPYVVTKAFNDLVYQFHRFINQFLQASSKSLEWKTSPRLFNNYGMAANNSEFCLLQSAIMCLCGNRARCTPRVSHDAPLDLVVSECHLIY